MKTTPLIQAEIQTDAVTVESKPSPHLQVPASESSIQPLAWNSRTKKAAMKKPLVRRLVEESWVVGDALAALITAGCEKKKSTSAWHKYTCTICAFHIHATHISQVQRTSSQAFAAL